MRRFRPCVISCVVAAATGCTHPPASRGSAPLAASATLSLWPGAPAGRGRSLERPPDPVRGAITRVTDITDPTLTVYRPTAARTGGAPAVLVFPGGGYQYLAVDIEGTDVCGWLTQIGVACVLVRYRVPQPADATRSAQPLQDAQRALALVRRNAPQWGIDARRVGVLGFSAGAHVAALLSVRTGGRTYAPVDAADDEPLRPDFAMLLYPAYLVRGRGDPRLATDVQPTSTTPPTFLVQTADDGVGAENSLQYALALRGANVPVELHLFPTGGHGYGLRAAVGEVAVAWPRLARRWLIGRGVVPAASEAAGR